MGVLTTSIAVLWHVEAAAQILVWDLDPSAPGIQGGDGDWDGGLFWLNSGNGIYQAWVSGSDAQFNNSGSVDASGITVDDITQFGVNSLTLVTSQPGGVLTLDGGDGQTLLQAYGTFNVTLPMVGQNGVKIHSGILGNVSFTAANLYAGDTEILTGTLKVSGGSAIPDSSTVVLSGALGGNVVFTVENSETIGGLSGGASLVSLVNGAVLTLGANNADTYFGGAILGSSSLGSRVIKTGSGAVRTVAGGLVNVPLEIQSGKWIAQNQTVSYSSIVVGQGGMFEVDGGALTVGSLTGQGEVKVGSGTLNLSGSGTFSGTFSGTGKLAVSGSSVTLAGINTFTGVLSLNNSFFSLPTLPAGTSAVEIQSATLSLTSPTATVSDRPVVMTGFSNIINTINVAAPTGEVTLQGVVSGRGSLAKGGPGTLILTNANTYSGSTEIRAGTLVTQNSNAIPNNFSVTVAAGAKLLIQMSETIAGLNGDGLVEIGSNTLTLASAGGGFSGQVSGAGQVISTGTQNFAGNNTFTGGLLVNGGEITATDFGSEGAPGPLGSGQVTLNGGGLRYIGSTPSVTNRPITLGPSGGGLATGTALLTMQSLLTSAGSLTIGLGGGGTVVLDNPANSFNDLRIEGVLATSEIADAGVNSSLGSGSAVTIAGGRLRFIGSVNDSSNRMLVYEGTANIEVDSGVTLQMDSATGAGSLVKVGAGTLVQASSSNNFTGGVGLFGGILQTGKLENSGVLSAMGTGNRIEFAAGQLSLAPGTTASTNRTIVLSGSGRIQGNGNTTTLTGNMNGVGTLTFAGANASSDTFVLNGANTATATFIVDKATVRLPSASGLPDSAGIQFADGGGGVLQLDVPETLAGITGAAGPGAGRLIANAPLTVNVNAGDVSSVGARIEGSGTITKAGAGIMALLGANTFTGNVVISGGTLSIPQWADDSAPPLGRGSAVFLGGSSSPRFEYGGVKTNTINHKLSLEGNGGVLSVPHSSGTLVWAGSVEGATTAELRKTGPGTLRLSGANGYAGATRIDEGKLQVIGSNALPNAGTVQVGSGATFELLTGTNETIGALLGEGSVQLGGQRLTLSTNASSSFDGLLLGSGQSRLEKRGSGTLTLSNPQSSFTGGIYVADGAVSVPYLRNAGINSPLGSAGPISLGDEVNNGRLILTSDTPGATSRPIVLGDAGGTIEVSHPGAEAVLTGSISGNGPLLKLGLGRMRFGSQFAGQIVVGNGTFAPAADISGSVIVINPGRVESINGVTHHLGNLLLAGGTMAPGGSGIAGALHADQVSVEGGVFELDLMSAGAGDYDQLVLTDGLEIGGPIELNLNLLYDPVDRVDVFRIVTSDTPTLLSGPNGRFRYGNNLLDDGEEFLVIDGELEQYFGIRYNPDGEGGVELFAAPEPGTSLLLLGGALCVAARRRRK